MKYDKIIWDDIEATAELSSFVTEGGVDEFHAILHVTPNGDLFPDQYARICKAEEKLLALTELEGVRKVVKRYLVSDAANQAPLMHRDADCSVSIIQQPPLDGSKVAVWIYMQRGGKVMSDGVVTIAEMDGLKHLWMMGMTNGNGNSYHQTEALLDRYAGVLDEHGGNLAENCVRTWFYVRDVDTQYKGMVNARKMFFTDCGLTENTHYIASTGIGGIPVDGNAIVQLDTYAILGLPKEQQRYLYAPTHLNPTYEYGVTFERGTVVDYSDRRHVIISGTASIDNKGCVVHEGDIVSQTHRMWENVETLLAEAGSGFADLAHIIVYLRDVADYSTIARLFAEKFPNTPYVITLAPVCRPSWLIEMECMAVGEL